MAAKNRRNNKLEKREITLVKGMLERGDYVDQDILAYFTRPTRSINHRVISEIRTGKKHRSIKPASPETVDDFLSSWPDLDHETGLRARLRMGWRVDLTEVKGRDVDPRKLWPDGPDRAQDQTLPTDLTDEEPSMPHQPLSTFSNRLSA